ncbi:transposase (fragment) [Xenorhabdus nematophila F1]
MMTIPGVGPITASLLSSQLGDGKQFSCSRDFAASMGLVPGNTVQGENLLCWVSANAATKICADCGFSAPGRL